MKRVAAVAAVLVLAVGLGGCGAGAPGTVTSTAPAPPATVVPAPEGASTPSSPPAPAIGSLAAADPAAGARVAGGGTEATVSTPTAETRLGLSAGVPAAFAPTPRPAPPPNPGTGSAVTIAEGPNDRLQIALTFDAGADTGYAAAILDFLGTEGVKATFGMTGRWAEENPDLVRRMVVEGHQLMNHSYSHESFTGASTGKPPKTAEQVYEELASTEAIVRDLTGYELKPYFRFPYGDYNADTLVWIAEAGYYVDVSWTCDSYGWKGRTGVEVAARCTTEALPHEITLLHVGAAAAGDFESLPAMLAFYRGAGYEFVTVEQMLQP